MHNINSRKFAEFTLLNSWLDRHGYSTAIYSQNRNGGSISHTCPTFNTIVNNDAKMYYQDVRLFLAKRALNVWKKSIEISCEA